MKSAKLSDSATHLRLIVILLPGLGSLPVIHHRLPESTAVVAVAAAAVVVAVASPHTTAPVVHTPAGRRHSERLRVELPLLPPVGPLDPAGSRSIFFKRGQPRYKGFSSKEKGNIEQNINCVQQEHAKCKMKMICS